MPFGPERFSIDEEASKNRAFESMGRRVEALQRGVEIIEKARAPFVESLRQRVERSAEAGDAIEQLRHHIEESGKRLVQCQQHEGGREREKQPVVRTPPKSEKKHRRHAKPERDRTGEKLDENSVHSASQMNA